MAYGDILRLLPMEGKSIIRDREKADKKLLNDKAAIIFNDICLRENLLPV